MRTLGISVLILSAVSVWACGSSHRSIVEREARFSMHDHRQSPPCAEPISVSRIGENGKFVVYAARRCDMEERFVCWRSKRELRYLSTTSKSEMILPNGSTMTIETQDAAWVGGKNNCYSSTARCDTLRNAKQPPDCVKLSPGERRLLEHVKAVSADARACANGEGAPGCAVALMEARLAMPDRKAFNVETPYYSWATLIGAGERLVGRVSASCSAGSFGAEEAESLALLGRWLEASKSWRAARATQSLDGLQSCGAGEPLESARTAFVGLVRRLIGERYAKDGLRCNLVETLRAIGVDPGLDLQGQLKCARQQADQKTYGVHGLSGDERKVLKFENRAVHRVPYLEAEIARASGRSPSNIRLLRALLVRSRRGACTDEDRVWAARYVEGLDPAKGIHDRQWTRAAEVLDAHGAAALCPEAIPALRGHLDAAAAAYRKQLGADGVAERWEQPFRTICASLEAPRPSICEGL